MNNEFDRFADRYDQELQSVIPGALNENAYFAEYKVALMARRLAAEKIERVLDFGCGCGRSLPHLRRYFPKAQLYGFDPSLASLDAAKQRTSEAVLISDCSQISSVRFDCVLAANVFHHIQEDRRQTTMLQCRELLMENGRFFLFEHNPFNPVTRRIFERCPFDRDAKMLYMAEAKELARRSELKVADSAYVLFFPKPLAFLRFMEPAFRRLPLGAQYYMELTK